MRIEKAVIEQEVEGIKLIISDIKSARSKVEKRELWNYARGRLSLMLSLNLISIGLWQDLSNLAGESI